MRRTPVDGTDQLSLEVEVGEVDEPTWEEWFRSLPPLDRQTPETPE